MTEKQKFDAVLKKLYELHKAKQTQSLEEIFESLGIYENRQEVWDMAERLKKGGFIIYCFTDAETDCHITSEGRDYVEDPPVANNSSNNFGSISISNSANVALNLASSDVVTNQIYQSEAQKLIDQFKRELEKVSALNREELEDLKECIDDIESRVRDQKKVPKFALDTLLSRTGNLATLSSLAIEIAMFLGYLPK
ncbi:MAG: hypothetical protein LH606_01415 [Cytophagaceae bacterium]|nr:hypothetical protein [Cytophagaceae bacterium]